MLAGVKDPIDVTTKIVKNDDKGWAQKPNWLEETVAKGLPKKEISPRKTNVKMLIEAGKSLDFIIVPCRCGLENFE